MKQRIRILVFILVVLSGGLFLLSCDEPAEDNNRPPDEPIVIVQDSDHEIASGASVEIWATVTDPDGDEVSVLWSATGGSFSNASSNITTWTAPTVTSEQQYTLTVQVQDTKGARNSKSVNLTVNPGQVDPPDEPTTIYITSYKDVFVASALPNNNFDITNQDFMGTFLPLSPEGSTLSFGETRIYVYFDLSSIPANSTIDVAEIIMRPKSDPGVTNSSTSCGALMLSQLNFSSSSTSWVESNLTWSSALNTSVTNSPRSGWLFTIANANSNLTASVKYDVQGYVNANSNYVNNYNGWVIQCFSSSSDDFKLFWSSDCDASSYYPKLKVTYR